MSKHVLLSSCGFDLGCSGISQYILENTKAALTHHRVDIIIAKQDLAVWPIKHENQNLIVLPKILSYPGTNALWHLFIMPLWIMYKRYVRQQYYDYLFLPAINRRLCAFYPIPSIGTLHDLSQFHVQQKYDFLRMFYIKHVVKHFINRAKNLHIVCVSKSTRDDLQHFYGYSTEAQVNYNGFNKSAYNREIPENYDEVMLKHQLTSGYFIYVARIEHPGKNHLNLIKAYLKLDQFTRQSHPLVLVGKPWSGSDIVFEYIKNHDHDGNIHYLGFIDFEDLPALYHGALANVMPSLYEGFCIPIVESMACNTLVCCADTSTMHEVTSDLALFFDPQDPEDIYLSLTHLIQKQHESQIIREKAYDHSQSFDWLKHFERLDSWASQWAIK